MSVLTEDINIAKGDVYSAMTVVFVGQFSHAMLGEQSPRIGLEKFILNAIKNCPLDKWPEQALDCIRTRLNKENLYIYETKHPFMECMDQIVFSTAGETLFCVYCSRV